MLRTLIFIWICGFALSEDYFGNFVGSFSNQDAKGDVYLINSTHVQITNFHGSISKLKELPFVITLSNGKRTRPVIYEYLRSEEGDWLKSFGYLKDEHTSGARFVVKMTGSAAQWKQFAVVDKNGNIISSVSLDKEPPKPFCCFERESNVGLFGEYGIISEPIEVLDSKTLRIPKFSYQASQTPDGYFFAGSGSVVDNTTGQKAVIVGRDNENRICPMVADIVNKDMVIRLTGDQTIYNIEWLSVFCYQYSHDFGHLDLGLVDDEELVPPFIPEIRSNAPQKLAAQKC